MARPPARLPALVQAAQELEDELHQYENAVAEAAGMRLNSEKNLGRTARALQAAAEFDDVAHDVDGLRQMLAALRRRLKPG
ncbi:MAG: hypothetical protein HYY18_14240 [Planctomycetes bacterium]|nr:hypothetical protein [Planctomycetota bacterium]